jgi:hypothetical protein
MRLLAIALFSSSILFEVAAHAEVHELRPVVITVKQHIVVTELAAPTKPLLVANPPPSFAPRVGAAVSKDAF